MVTAGTLKGNGLNFDRLNEASGKTDEVSEQFHNDNRICDTAVKVKMKVKDVVSYYYIVSLEQLCPPTPSSLKTTKTQEQ